MSTTKDTRGGKGNEGQFDTRLTERTGTGSDTVVDRDDRRPMAQSSNEVTRPNRTQGTDGSEEA